MVVIRFQADVLAPTWHVRYCDNCALPTHAQANSRQDPSVQDYFVLSNRGR